MNSIADVTAPEAALAIPRFEDGFINLQEVLRQLADYNAFTQWCRAHSVECGRGAAAKANLELLESLARVADFELATPFRVYFCDPHSPWERPSNENTNGLIREFFPKGTGFADVADEEVERAQWLLNNRPRKVLGWKLPSEVMQEVLAECAMTG